MGWVGDLPEALLLGAIVIAIMAAAELWRRRGSPRPEWTRKLIHSGTGAVALAFPFLISSPTVVFVLVGFFTLLVTFGKRFGFLRSLHGVMRRTEGAHYYPLAIFLLFLLARDRPWLYVSAVLVLGVSDALAAVIGSQYGFVRYRVDEAERSLEGSLVFLVAAFLVVHLPMLLMTDLPRATCVLVAVLAAALATAVEAISLRGSDNLFVPLVVYLVVDRMSVKPVADIASLNVGLLVMALGISVIVRRSRGFNVGGVLAMILFGFTAWVFGPLYWAVPFFLGLAAYFPLWFTRARTSSIPAAVVLEALVPTACVLAASSGFERPDLFYAPYVASITFLTVLCMVYRIRRLGQASPWNRKALGAALVVPAWVMTAVVPWQLQSGVDFEAVLGVGAVCALGSVANALVLLRGEPADTTPTWPPLVLLLQFAVIGGVLLLQWSGAVPTWTPA
jgi:dolichol kinase